jgi:hypothetical protein
MEMRCDVLQSLKAFRRVHSQSDDDDHRVVFGVDDQRVEMFVYIIFCLDNNLLTIKMSSQYQAQSSINHIHNMLWPLQRPLTEAYADLLYDASAKNQTKHRSKGDK